jgi:hypothetical protein
MIRDMYRDISYLKKGYQPESNIVKYKKGDLVTDWHSFKGRIAPKGRDQAVPMHLGRA